VTNPETCRHNIITAGITDNIELIVACVSCGTDVTTLDKRVGKNYEYDIDENVWVHTPKSSVPINQYDVDMNTWRDYRDEERKAGRRFIPFEDWRNEGPQGEIRI
jgi:hypothetical protein